METINKLVKYFAEATEYRRILLLAALAGVSALLSQLTANLETALRLILNVTLWTEQPVPPILPGIYFGFVLAAGGYAWKRRNLFTVGVILLGTVIAWVAAFEIAQASFVYFDKICNCDTTPMNIFKGSDNKLMVTLFLRFAGIVGGLFGGILTLVGVSIAVPDFRTINNWSRTLLVASLAGTLLGIGSVSLDTPLPLFIVWQVTVAASIAYGWTFQETLKPESPLGAVSGVVGIRRGAISGNMKVQFQAARSIG